MTAAITSSNGVSTEGSSSSKEVKRAFCRHQPKWQRFQPTLLKADNHHQSAKDAQKQGLVSSSATPTYQYQRQYAHVYSQRLNALRPRCWKAFAEQDEKISSSSSPSSPSRSYVRVNRVLELRENIPIRIVGTLVKETTDVTEEPIVKKQDDEDKDLETALRLNTCRPSDALFLEDESGRVALQFNDEHDNENDNDTIGTCHEYCTGVVLGIQGKVDAFGFLHIEQVVLPAKPALLNVSSSSSSSSSPEAFMVPAEIHGTNDETTTATATATVPAPTVVAPHLLIVSSLLCGDANVPSIPREMLLSYLQGQFTNDAAKVCRVLIVGGGPSSQDPLLGVKEFDAFLLQLTKAGIPVDVMPGKNDPTTANWPQRPLHSSLLPHATAILHRTPNPYASVLGDKFVIATDGTNIQDLKRHILTGTTTTNTTTTTSSSSSSSNAKQLLTDMQALQKTLEWSHLCPTGPDSVPTVPHMEQDPMVLDHQPHLYISGNTKSFAKATTTTTSTSTLSNDNHHPQTTLLCVPSFAKTGEAVLVNLDTMGVELLRFKEEEAGD